jgi:hypothetical protein
MTKSKQFFLILVFTLLTNSCVTLEAMMSGHFCSPSRYVKQVDEMMRIMECGGELVVVSYGVHGERDFEGSLQEIYEENCTGVRQKSSDLGSKCTEMYSILQEYD